MNRPGELLYRARQEFAGSSDGKRFEEQLLRALAHGMDGGKVEASSWRESSKTVNTQTG